MHTQNAWHAAFVKWLPFALTILILSAAVYLAVQQSHRQSANDPQIQIAEDVAVAITKGTAQAESIVPPTPAADITESLQPFLIVYNSTGTPLGGSVGLDGKIPTPPSEVFDDVQKNDQNRFTWTPKQGLRIAAVVTKYSGPESGYVLVGRSLREVEARERQLMLMVGIAALAGLLLAYLTVLNLVKLERHHASSGEHHEHHHS